MLNFFEANKKIFSLAFPLILTSLISAAASIISMYLISLLGQDALAAGAIISSTYSFLIMISISFLFPLGILVSQKHAMGGHHEIGRLVSQGFLLALLLCIPLITLMWNCYPILLFLKQPMQVARLVADYFQSLTFGMVPTLLCAVLNQFLTGISKPKIMTLLSVISLFLFTILGYLFLFGIYGMPNLGIAGVGYAGALTAWVSFAGLIIYIILNKKYKPYQLFPLKIFTSFRGLAVLFNLGWPISIQYGMEILSFTLMTYLIGTLGSQSLAAQQIALQCSLVGVMIVMGLSQATSILIGQTYARKDFPRMTSLFHASLFMACAFMGINALLYFLYPHFFISLYLDMQNPDNQFTVKLAETMLTILAATQIFDGIRNVVTGALRGCQDMRFPMLIGIVSCWIIAMPLCVLFMFKFGALGVRAGFLIGVTIGAIVLTQRFYKIKNKFDINPVLNEWQIQNAEHVVN